MDDGGEGEERRPHKPERVCKGDVVDGVHTADTLGDVGAVTLNDHVQAHDEDWYAEASGEIDSQIPTFLSLCDKDRGNPVYFEQAPVDNDGHGSNGDRESDIELCRYVAPEWSKIADVIVPDNPVDEEDGVCEECPADVECYSHLCHTKKEVRGPP